MRDVKCPYCEEDQEINHDDGYGYDEGMFHEQECSNCEKMFVYTIEISFCYEASKADCLNGSEHILVPSHTYPVEFSTMQCAQCGYSRKPTDDEMATILERRR